MAIALTLKDYLRRHEVEYEVISHHRTLCSSETAAAAHVPGERLAKSVVLEDAQGYVMAVLPATHRIRLGALREQLNRDLRLASETELASLFKDCVPGAIPPVGDAYGMQTVLEHSVAGESDVYFEAGDHEELIHVNGRTFTRVMSGAEHLHFGSRP